MSGASATIRVHATAVRLGTAALPFEGPEDAGILLLGPSGSGKSDVALRLIAAGARLISDDQTELWQEDSQLWARAPRSLAGLLEIRGAGIVRVRAADQAALVLAVRLEETDPIARLPERETYAPPGLSTPFTLPLMTIRPFEASTPAKIAGVAASLALGRFVEDNAPAK